MALDLILLGLCATEKSRIVSVIHRRSGPFYFFGLFFARPPALLSSSLRSPWTRTSATIDLHGIANPKEEHPSLSTRVRMMFGLFNVPVDLCRCSSTALRRTQFFQATRRKHRKSCLKCLLICWCRLVNPSFCRTLLVRYPMLLLCRWFLRYQSCYLIAFLSKNRFL